MWVNRRRAEENREEITRELAVHISHRDLESDCLLCIVLAIGLVENSGKREDEARRFLAVLPKPVILNALVAVRAELGHKGKKSHRWLWHNYLTDGLKVS